MREHDLAGRRLLAVTEEELQRVVLDIHDGPVQNLFAALGQLSVVRARLQPIDAAREGCMPPLSRAVELLEASLGEIRDIVGTLHAPEFTERKLTELVENLVVQHESLTGACVGLELATPIPQVQPVVKIALYRILQEALSNIRRHAGSPEATVRLWSEDGLVYLEIEDHGRGFEPPPLVGPNATERQVHIGLRGMRERAALANGELTVESHPGKGTRVRVQVPNA
jgi:signal transduction histidine kinase